MADLFGEEPDKIYQIVEELGRGQFGKVFKGLRKDDGEVVAIKILTIDETADDDTFRAVAKEIQMLRDCNHHSIVGFYGAYIKGNELWIIMEFCDAGSCSKMMTKMGKNFLEEEIAAVVYQVLQGLEYLANARKMHRDVKADNLLLKSSGEVKIADLGVAAQLKNTMDFHKTATGTPYWMAPELVSETRYNSKVDVWSLGITAIELAERKPPLFDFVPMRALFMIAQQSRPPPALAKPGDWSPDFNDFVTKCLVKDPELRASATDLLEHPWINQVKPRSKEVVASLVQRYTRAMAERRSQRDEKKEKVRILLTTFSNNLNAKRLNNERERDKITREARYESDEKNEESENGNGNGNEGKTRKAKRENDEESEEDDADVDDEDGYAFAKTKTAKKSTLTKRRAKSPNGTPELKERKTIRQRIKERRQKDAIRPSTDGDSVSPTVTSTPTSPSPPSASQARRWWQRKEKKVLSTLKSAAAAAKNSTPAPPSRQQQQQPQQPDRRGRKSTKTKTTTAPAAKKKSKSEPEEEEDEDDDTTTRSNTNTEDEESTSAEEDRRRRRRERRADQSRVVAEEGPEAARGMMGRFGRRWSLVCFHPSELTRV